MSQQPPSNFQFLKAEWPDLFESASKAELLAHPDPRSACFYARRTLELAVRWLYKHDPALRLPYQEHLSALLHEPTFRAVVGQTIFQKAKLVKELGNLAVHSHKKVAQYDAVTAAKELFHVTFWLARTYARLEKPHSALAFNPAALPDTAPAPPQTLDQLRKLEEGLRERDEKLASLLSDKASLDEELRRLREEFTAIKRQNEAVPDTHDYSEAETRDRLIDVLLKEAGWGLNKKDDIEYPVTGMPNPSGNGFVDYVLWGDDGLPLGLVEAKRTKVDARQGQQQAKLYADCLERQFGRRPVIFYSNGYEHWLWDDQNYPPRTVQGFYKKGELELMIQRRGTRRRLSDTAINEAIAGRPYQARAIRRISETFEQDHQRKALVVMATGAGKTRTVIALCDLLMRCNWAKRILFLADRIALVNQACGAFKRHLPDAPPVNLVEEKDEKIIEAGRVLISTYPTMMGLIEEARDGQKRFGVGHFDLIIIDEAHRSVYKKYLAIFDYFDSLLVGLTATPKDEIDRDTYKLFDLERGVPTDHYSLEEAVKDRYLVPPKAVSVPVKFQREGITYDDLTEEEKADWDAAEWNDDGEVPERVEAGAVNKWLFNRDTVDKVLEHLMLNGQKVAGGDRLGKTIIFAKNHQHADFIVDRFNAHYPRYRGEFARVIDFTVKYAQTLIDDFSIAEKAPHIAVSVDMLDTGIDVPEVVNLIFFKLVRSKTKFWQMVGRGTRLRPDLFGPEQHKEFFYIFDYCGNLEFFSQNMETVEGSVQPSLGEKLFTARLDLVRELSKIEASTGTVVPEQDDLSMQQYRPSPSVPPQTSPSLLDTIRERLYDEVTSMNVENFVIRPYRRIIDKFSHREAWNSLRPEQLTELGEIAGLPSGLDSDAEEAKRFDLLIFTIQLALLKKRSFAKLRQQVVAIASLLEDKSSIPMVQAQFEIILDVQTDEWWRDITTPMLEDLRKRLRSLVKLIDKQQRKPIYTDFTDQLGTETTVELPGFATPDSYERFRAKARQFLKAHENHISIHKLRLNEPLTPTDLDELERMLAESGIGTPEDVQKAKEESEGLGLFVRSLVGMDRTAAKQAFAGFLSGKTLTSNQIEFIDMVIEHLTEHGSMDAALLYGSPYTDFNPRGVNGVFAHAQVIELMTVLNDVRERAAA